MLKEKEVGGAAAQMSHQFLSVEVPIHNSPKKRHFFRQKYLERKGSGAAAQMSNRLFQNSASVLEI